jgi:hypothetical protein
MRQGKVVIEKHLTMPNHPRIKSSTLRAICMQAGIARRDFLRASKEP